MFGFVGVPKAVIYLWNAWAKGKTCVHMSNDSNIFGFYKKCRENAFQNKTSLGNIWENSALSTFQKSNYKQNGFFPNHAFKKNNSEANFSKIWSPRRILSSFCFLCPPLSKVITHKPLLLNRASQVALVVKNMPANAGDIRDVVLIPGSERVPRGGYSNPLKYSCLLNSMDRRAW